MKDQYQNERLNDTSSQQLELALHDGDNIICTRACEGVSGSTHQIDAELHLSQEDAPLETTGLIGSSQTPVSDEQNTFEQAELDNQIEQEAYEEAVDRIGDNIYQRVMGALRESLTDAGVSERRIDMEEDLIEGALDALVFNVFDEFNVEEILGDILETYPRDSLDKVS